MTQRLGYEWLGPFEVAEVLLRQQPVLAVVSQEHPLGANKQDAAVPFRDRPGLPGLGLVGPLVPRQSQGWHVVTCIVLISHVHRRGSDFGVRWWPERLDGSWRLKLECPERQVDPVR